MTGYGRKENISSDLKCSVEIRSVNHRYLDISIRMPHMMNPYEDTVRKMLSKAISRGKVDVFIRVETYGHQKIEINTHMLGAYYTAFNNIKEQLGLSDEVKLDTLVSMPDVFLIDKSLDEEAVSSVWSALEEVVSAAVSKFNAMRLLEGGAVAADINSKLEQISSLLELLKKRLPFAEEEYERRLRERIAEVSSRMPLAEADESRVLVELALHADKVCINEEVARLESHMQQFEQIFNEKEAVGRKLDFLLQEVNREINTIGSKTGDIEISKIVVDMKSAAEKIREQVQNVE